MTTTATTRKITTTKNNSDSDNKNPLLYEFLLNLLIHCLITSSNLIIENYYQLVGGNYYDYVLVPVANMIE